jgi:hypothetical protein
VRVAALLSALLFVAACTTAPVRQEAPRSVSPSEKPYFDAALADKLTVGTSTRKDVLNVMGRPYADDPRKETGRLVYRHTDMTQLVFEFSGDVLKAKLWGDIYGIHKGQ